MFASESTASFLKVVVGVQFNPTPDPNPDQTKRARVVSLKRNVFVSPSQLQFAVFMDAQISQHFFRKQFRRLNFFRRKKIK